MSGGFFDYKEYALLDIAVRIEDYLEENRASAKEEQFSEETVNEFKQAIQLLKKAYVFTHRIDYLIEGDNGEDSFHERLKEDLKKVEE